MDYLCRITYKIQRLCKPLPLPTSEKCKARGFTVIVDGRKSQWNTVKTVVLMLQVSALNVVPVNLDALPCQGSDAIGAVSERDSCRGVASLRGEAR